MISAVQGHCLRNQPPASFPLPRITAGPASTAARSCCSSHDAALASSSKGEEEAEEGSVVCFFVFFHGGFLPINKPARTRRNGF